MEKEVIIEDIYLNIKGLNIGGRIKGYGSSKGDHIRSGFDERGS